MRRIMQLKNVRKSKNRETYKFTELPVLNKKEEIALFKAYKRGDQEAGHKLMLHNLPYVVKTAYKFKSYNMPAQDLIQEGVLGLMRAIDKFKINKNVRLLSYAQYWIRARILVYIQNNWHMVRRATTMQNRAEFIRYFQGEMSDHPKYIRDHHFEIGENEAVTQPYEFGLVSDLEIAKKFLDTREKKIIDERFAEEPKSLGEIGKKLNISKERVRQLEKRALSKMQGIMSL